MTTLIQQKLTAHPVPTDSTNPKGKWKIVTTTHLPNFYKQLSIIDGKGKEQYFTAQQPLHCFPRPATMRSRYCTSSHAMQPLSDRCLISILAQNVTVEVCRVEETTQSDSLQYLADHNSVTDIDQNPELDLPHNLVITNDDDVSLMTTCTNNNSETVTQLPHAARVHVPAICHLKLLNAPDVFIVQPGTRVPFVSHNTPTSQIKTLQDLINKGKEVIKDDLQRHFHDYGFIYIIVITSIIVVILLVILIYFLLCKCHFQSVHVTESSYIPHQPTNFRRSVSRTPVTVSFRPQVALFPNLPILPGTGPAIA
jgi:hypothetical protein